MSVVTDIRDSILELYLWNYYIEIIIGSQINVIGSGSGLDSSGSGYTVSDSCDSVRNLQAL